jgi:transposase
MKTIHSTTSSEEQKCGGVDVGKAFLDAAIEGGPALRTPNTPEGRAALLAFFRAHGVACVGLEASGGYELEIRGDLRDAGFEAVLLQPAQVRAYARMTRQRAKTDRIDAALIARCVDVLKSPARQEDPRLAALAERLTFLEQIEEDIARLRTRRDRFREPDLIARLAAEIKRRVADRKAALAELIALLRAHDDLAHRFDLIESIDGLGPRTALTLVVRMPELGSLSREKASSLAGMAPVTRESGRWTGQAHVEGGRSRVGRALFAAAQAACQRWNPQLVAFYRRLRAAGKHHSVAVVACARKLVIYANTVLANGRRWVNQC